MNALEFVVFKSTCGLERPPVAGAFPHPVAQDLTTDAKTMYPLCQIPKLTVIE
jgi:hypothetical protein